MKTETGVRITVILVCFCIAFFVYGMYVGLVQPILK
jgi:hypothetical protein